MTVEFRDATIDFVGTIIGKEREATKLPEDRDDTKPEPDSGWYHVAYEDLMGYIRQTNYAIYSAWKARPIHQRAYFLISPDACQIGSS